MIQTNELILDLELLPCYMSYRNVAMVTALFRKLSQMPLLASRPSDLYFNGRCILLAMASSIWLTRLVVRNMIPW